MKSSSSVNVAEEPTVVRLYRGFGLEMVTVCELVLNFKLFL